MLYSGFTSPALMMSALVAIALAVSPAQAQAPRPGQSGPGQAAPSGQRGQQAQPPVQRGQAQQQQQAPPQPAPPKPYKAIAVTPPQPYDDPSFVSFRKQLTDIANRKDRAALAKIVASNFFWMGERGDKANKKKSGIDNLAAAIGLDAKDGSGWQTLIAAADEATAEPVPERKGILCSPANPTFDEAAADQVAKDTGTDPGEWAYTSKPDVEVHDAPKADAPVIEKLGQQLVRTLPEQPTPGAQQQDMPFVRVVASSGKVGYVAEEFLSSLDSDQICYVKDGAGWKIAGYAGND